jgi:hypothetical protein
LGKKPIPSRPLLLGGVFSTRKTQLHHSSRVKQSARIISYAFRDRGINQHFPRVKFVTFFTL